VLVQTWSEHQYQTDEMSNPKVTPVHGRSVVRLAGLIIFIEYEGGVPQELFVIRALSEYAAKNS